MGRALFSKSLIQFSADGWGCVPSLLFIWGQTMEKVMKIMATSFKRSHACTATLTAPNPAAGHHGPKPPLETPGHSWSSLGGLLWDHCSFFLGPGAHKVLLEPSKSLFPVLCKVCENCYNPITVLYSDSVSWVPRLTLLVLQTNWTYEHALLLEWNLLVFRGLTVYVI